jgi:hypothetical protein
MATPWSEMVQKSVKAVLQDEQSKSEVVLSKVPEKKNDNVDIDALCNLIDVTVRPTAVVHLGKDEKKGPKTSQGHVPHAF